MRKPVIASQCEHWRGNPPFTHGGRIPTKNGRLLAAIFLGMTRQLRNSSTLQLALLLFYWETGMTTSPTVTEATSSRGRMESKIRPMVHVALPPPELTLVLALLISRVEPSV